MLKNVQIGPVVGQAHFLVLRWLLEVEQWCWSMGIILGQGHFIRDRQDKPFVTPSHVMVTLSSKVYELPFLFTQLIPRGSPGRQWVQKWNDFLQLRCIWQGKKDREATPFFKWDMIETLSWKYHVHCNKKASGLCWICVVLLPCPKI